MTSTDLHVDVVVVGSGAAGLSVALGLVATRDVLVVEDGDGSTRWAQGGVAAAFGDDSPEEHAHDTDVAGRGLGDPAAVRRLVEEGPQRVADLVARGARLDRSPDGRLLRSREGGHRRPRVLHAGGDATGAEVWRTLQVAADRAGVRRLRDTRVTGLLLTGSSVTGLHAVRPDGAELVVRARAVVLATGGLGHVYAATTNPAGVRGEGLALALLAGATTADLQFVQFHPTALATGAAGGQLPLVTEALRGEGAVLLDGHGRAFMAGLHPMADLAPRDVVAAAVHRAVRDTGSAWLDCRGVDDVHRRFPTVAASCDAIGIDLARDRVPVRPAEHFHCGGVATDAWGATDVPGLYAVGEVARTGVHGANRLASNGLLEGLVYGARVAATLTLELPSRPAGATRSVQLRTDPVLAARAAALMDLHVGVERTQDRLSEAHAWLSARADDDPTCRVGAAVTAAALSGSLDRGEKTLVGQR
ncbi:MAG: FAD-binding protein [Marmoricola sp.]|nr:FAD-binding protein [Marmoricola sp.]